MIRYRAGGGDKDAVEEVAARLVIGADGARSKLARQAFKEPEPPSVFAYHEIVRSPEGQSAARPGLFDAERCDVYYQGRISPDFYGWIFPHGGVTSVGVGSAEKGFSLRGAVDALRAEADLSGCETLRREGAPIPLRARKRWDNGRDLLLAGDAAGVVAPASGEGIYYAMLSGELAAEAVAECLRSGNPRPWRARASASCATMPAPSGSWAPCRTTGTARMAAGSVSSASAAIPMCST